MMGRRTSDQSQLFYLFNLEERLPASHMLRRINPVVTIRWDSAMPARYCE